MELASEYESVNLLFSQLSASGINFEPIDAFFCGFMTGRHNVPVLSIIEYTITIINESSKNREQKERKCGLFETVSKSFKTELLSQDPAQGKKKHRKEKKLPFSHQEQHLINSPTQGNINLKLSRCSSSSSSSSSSARRKPICPICLEEIPVQLGFVLQKCSHFYHKDCILTHLESEINSRKLRLDCPDCHANLEQNELALLLPSALQSKLSKTMKDLYLETHPDEAFYCGAPGCGHSNWNRDKKNVVQCENCLGVYCVYCKKSCHSGPCQISDQSHEMPSSEHLKLLGIASCPTCRRLIQRDEGCTQIRCVCQTLFCFNCEKVNGNGSYCNCPLFASSKTPDLSHLALSNNPFSTLNDSRFSGHNPISEMKGMEEEVDINKTNFSSFGFNRSTSENSSFLVPSLLQKSAKDKFFISSSSYIYK